jgi:hypothetical protein
MSRASAERVAMVSLLLAMVVVPPSQLRATPSHVSLWPRCLEPRIAAGDVYPADRGLALAVTRGIASHEPALAPLVDAVGDYEATHPVASEDSFDFGLDWPGTGGPLYFTLIVIALAERPELARPDLMTQLVQIGRGHDLSRPHGGVTGVVEFVYETGAGDRPGPNADLYLLVAHRADYAWRDGIVGSDDWTSGYGSARGVLGCDDDRDSR